MPGSIERAEATDTLLSYWHGKMQSHERNAYSALDSAERLTMLAKIHRLMREGKLK